MAATPVTFSNDQGEQLAGLMFLPGGGVTARAFAVFAHCFTCTKNLTASRNIAEAMSAEGIGTLVFDFTGLGDSAGEFADSNFSSNITDLVAAANFLAREYAAPQLLVGHSLGGTAVLKAAAAIDSARAVATIGSPSHAQHVARLLTDDRAAIERDGQANVQLAGRPFLIKKQFLDDIETQPVLESVAKLRKALLVMHAPMDATVSVDNATDLFVAAKHPKSFVSLDDADHLLGNKAHSRYAGRVIACWASKYVDGAPPAQATLAPVAGAVVARTRIDGFLTQVVADGHALTADEPVAVGGTGAGPSPYDLLAAALATCTTMTLKMYASHKQWPMTSATATVTHKKIHASDCADCASDESAKVDVLERTVAVTGDLDDAQKKRLLEIADRCPVHRTLHGEIKVRTHAA